MNAETPQISSSCYSSNISLPWESGWGTSLAKRQDDTYNKLFGHHQSNFINPVPPQQPQLQQTESPMPKENPTRRIVQVFIADPNENLPLDRCVLYAGPQKLTDLTDTELFFEVPIKDLLDKHNATRITFPNKEASKLAGKDILLDPVKIRELRMVVVTVAQF